MPEVDLTQISTFVFDVDGVMTDGRVLVTEAGELLRTMSVRDGYALKRAIDAGYRVAVITGGRSEGVRLRLAGLGINDYYSGVHDKLPVLEGYAERHGVDLREAAYLGDDVLDVPAMRACGLGCTPRDGCREALEAADVVTDRVGGDGCVRELIESVLRAQGKWARA